MARWSSPRCSILFSLALLIGPPGAVFAASTVSTIRDTNAPATTGAGAAAVVGVCTLESGTRDVGVSQGFLGDEFTMLATHISPASCTACPQPTSLLLNNVSFAVKWLEPMSWDVEVSVVGATIGAGPQGPCLAPDFTSEICRASTYTLHGVAGPQAAYTLALPASCCIAGDAFVVLRFRNRVPADANTPALGSAFPPCRDCEQYFTTATGFPIPTDWCPQAGNPLWVAVGADCCAPTPTREPSWGTLKVHSR